MVETKYPRLVYTSGYESNGCTRPGISGSIDDVSPKGASEWCRFAVWGDTAGGQPEADEYAERVVALWNAAIELSTAEAVEKLLGTGVTKSKAVVPVKSEVAVAVENLRKTYPNVSAYQLAKWARQAPLGALGGRVDFTTVPFYTTLSRIRRYDAKQQKGNVFSCP